MSSHGHRRPDTEPGIERVRRGKGFSYVDPFGKPIEHAVAAAVRLIDTCLLRVGNERSAANGHHGATTLTIEHVIDDDTLELDSIAKSGKTQTVVVEDDELADILIALAEDADDELFWFEDDHGERRRATANDINAFIVEHAGPAFSAKDFRTWGGAETALEARADGAVALEAVDAAADALGNTRRRSQQLRPPARARRR